MATWRSKSTCTTHPYSLTHAHFNTHTHTHMHALMHSHTHAYARTHAYAHMHTHTHTHTHMHTHVHTHTHAHACTHAYARTHTGLSATSISNLATWLGAVEIAQICIPQDQSQTGIDKLNLSSQLYQFLGECLTTITYLWHTHASTFHLDEFSGN